MLLRRALAIVEIAGKISESGIAADHLHRIGAAGHDRARHGQRINVRLDGTLVPRRQTGGHFGLTVLDYRNLSLACQ